MEWSEGRKLTKLTYHPTYSSTNRVTTYQYDHNGTLIKRTDSSGSYVIFQMVDGKAVGETRYNASGTVTLYMRYTFDEQGSVVGISLWYPSQGAWTDFYFAKNLQGDVVAVYRESDKALVASYSYDSWGNILSKSGNLADINPFRYRSYYFDTESWFYYLQSRFYDPAIGRFINADAYTSTGQGQLGYNMFAYCNNNPVIYKDTSGYAIETVFDIISLGTSIVDVVVNPWDPWAWLGLIGDIADVAIPCVGGLGEAVDVLKAMNVIDESVDVVKLAENTLNVIAKAANTASTGGEFVYTAYKAGPTGILEYVGITNDFSRRESEWDAIRKINPYIEGVDRDTARCAEQTVISLFGRNGNTLSNIRNSIGRKGKLNTKYAKFFGSFF